MLKTYRHRLQLLAAAEIAVPEGIIAHGDIVQPDAVIGLLRTLRQRSGHIARHARYCVASLPEPTSFMKLLSIIPSPTNDLTQDIITEAATHLPMAINEAYLDWQQLSTNSTTGNTVEILLVATPRQTADRYTAVLAQAGLEPMVLELEPIAIGRAVLAEDPAAAKQSVAVLDLGGTRASFTVFHLLVPQFTVSLPIAGADWTAAIAKNLQLDLAQAESAKQRCGLNNPACNNALVEILEESLADLGRRLQETLGYYEGHFNQHQPVQRIILTGGGAQLSGLDGYLSKQLHHDVEIAQPLRNISTRKQNLTSAQSLQYSTALGLARRALIKIVL